MPDPDGDEDDDVFMSEVVYEEEKSPKDIDQHLLASDTNMIHFKALTKYYGVNQYLIKIPDSAEVATEEKF